MAEPRQHGGEDHPALCDLDPSDRLLALRAPATELPDPELASRRQRAFAAVRQLLGPEPHLRVSPLGPAWSADIDVYGPVDDRALVTAGWVSLDGLLAAVGSPSRGRWAVVVEGEVVGAVDLASGPPPDPVAAVLAGARRRGRVGLREVLELRALRRAGHRLPADPVVAVAAAVEAGLGGALLGDLARAGRTAPCPTLLPGRWRRRLAALRRRTRPRLRVALSGVDGSGKSTAAVGLVSALDTVGVPARRVWTRPGMRLGPLEQLARWVKRLRGQPATPGVRAVAAGERPPQRRGLVGWTWALLVVCAYLWDVWRQTLAAEGVVVFDRHRADAEVTLDFVYGGVDLRLQRWLVRRLPRADLTIYLDVPVEVAVARKPGDPIGRYAVAAQLDRYPAALPEDAIHVDATGDPTQLVARLLAVVASAAGGR